MQGRGLAIAGVRGWGVRGGAKIAGVDWGGVWVGWSQLATFQSTEKQLNLELILFDERRFGTETKLQLLATFHSTEKQIKSAVNSFLTTEV